MKPCSIRKTIDEVLQSHIKRVVKAVSQTVPRVTVAEVQSVANKAPWGVTKISSDVTHASEMFRVRCET